MATPATGFFLNFLGIETPRPKKKEERGRPKQPKREPSKEKARGSLKRRGGGGGVSSATRYKKKRGTAAKSKKSLGKKHDPVKLEGGKKRKENANAPLCKTILLSARRGEGPVQKSAASRRN